jgi:hypothetical protein
MAYPSTDATSTRNRSISSAVPIADKVISKPAQPSPATSFVASFAKAPPLSGNPAMASAVNAAAAITKRNAHPPLIATTPTARTGDRKRRGATRG